MLRTEGVTQKIYYCFITNPAFVCCCNCFWFCSIIRRAEMQWYLLQPQPPHRIPKAQREQNLYFIHLLLHKIILKIIKHNSCAHGTAAFVRRPCARGDCSAPALHRDENKCISLTVVLLLFAKTEWQEKRHIFYNFCFWGRTMSIWILLGYVYIMRCSHSLE